MPPPTSSRAGIPLVLLPCTSRSRHAPQQPGSSLGLHRRAGEATVLAGSGEQARTWRAPRIGRVPLLFAHPQPQPQPFCFSTGKE